MVAIAPYFSIFRHDEVGHRCRRGRDGGVELRVTVRMDCGLTVD